VLLVKFAIAPIRSGKRDVTGMTDFFYKDVLFRTLHVLESYGIRINIGYKEENDAFWNKVLPKARVNPLQTDAARQYAVQECEKVHAQVRV
jgi:hypothetical protein